MSSPSDSTPSGPQPPQQPNPQQPPSSSNSQPAQLPPDSGPAQLPPNPQPTLTTPGGTTLPDLASPQRVVLMGLGLLAFAALLFYLLFKVWPPEPWPSDGDKPVRDTIDFFGWGLFGRPIIPTYSVPTSQDERLLLLVICAGALGSYVHAATSYSTYVGNRKFISSWTWWYILRPLVGVALALIVYFSIRGGFLLLVNDARDAARINPYGVAAVASLVGLFSKQAADKLNEVFSTLFRPAPDEGDNLRKDSLQEGHAAIAPAAVRAGVGRVALLVGGVNFVETSVVRLAPKEDPTKVKDLETTFVSSTQLLAYVEPGDTAQETTFEVMVFTPPPGGGATKPVELRVLGAT